MNALEIKNLTKRYKNFTLDGVDLEVPQGTVVGFIGENGAGKTTTLKAVLGLIKPDSGEIKIFGKDVSELTQTERQKIGVVFDEGCLPQALNLYETQKVMANVFASWDKNKFAYLTNKANLPQDKAIKDFSRGMKMKAAIAVALSHESDLLILDEPTGGLDPVVRDEILELFYDYMQDENKSIIISSHILSDLQKLCDYIAFIQKGKIVFFEEKDKLLYGYAVIRGADEDTVESVKSFAVKKIKREYGTDLLVKRSGSYEFKDADNASVEDIMLFYAKGSDL